MPAMPEGDDVREGILKGLYKFRATAKPKAKLRAQLLGSGAILPEVVKAQAILDEKYNVGADVWSVTSYNELYRDGHAAERWNMLHPGETPKVPYVTQKLAEAQGVFVAASDYMKVLPDTLDRWLPRPDRVARHRRLRPQREPAPTCATTSRWTPVRRRGDAVGAGAARARSTRRSCRRRSRIWASTRRRRIRRRRSVVASAITIAMARRHEDAKDGLVQRWLSRERSCASSRLRVVVIGSLRAMRVPVADFVIPELGENVAGGDVVRILVKPGDTLEERPAGPRARDRQGDHRGAVERRRRRQGAQGQDRRQGESRAGRADGRRGGARRRARSYRRRPPAARRQPRRPRREGAPAAKAGRSCRRQARGSRRRRAAARRRRARRAVQGRRHRARRACRPAAAGSAAGAPCQAAAACVPAAPSTRRTRASWAWTSRRSKAPAPAAASRSTT